MSDILGDLKPRLASKNLRMVFAAESGSRAWGFASPDSDYDIRFIFAKPLDEYLALEDGMQDIQYKHGELDYAGWDLRKALRLAQKSNPSLIEWLGSPIIYDDPIGFRASLLAIVGEHYSPRALAHHYINFMRNIRGKYMHDWVGEYTLKRYFYALRPILCVMWMKQYGEIAPTAFPDMLKACEVGALTLPDGVVEATQKILKLKAETKEQLEHKEPVLDEFIKHWYENGHLHADAFPGRQMPLDLLNDLFRATVRKLEDGQ